MSTVLVKHVDEISNSPVHIKNMRDLVVQLAVEGRLLTQLQADGRAEDLIDEISSARESAIKSGIMRKQKSIPEFDEDIISNYPSSWTITCLAALGEIAPRNELDDEQVVSFFPMPLIPTVIGENAIGETRKWKEIKKGFTHVADGDVALGKITPCFQNLKSCVFRGLQAGAGAGTTELHVLRPVAGLVEPDFLLLVLKSPKFIRCGKEKMTGTAGQQRVSRDYFAFTPIGLPPHAEQKRIVAKVDELMALIDDLEQKQNHRDEVRQKFQTAALSALSACEDDSGFAYAWSRVKDQWKIIANTAESVTAIRQSIRAVACEGRLTSTERKLEATKVTGEMLKNEIAEFRLTQIDQAVGQELKELQTIVKKLKELTIATPTSPSIPECWSWVSLLEVCLLLVDCHNKTAPYTNHGIPIIRTSNIKNGIMDVESAKRISDETYEFWSRRCPPRSGDIIFTREAPMGEAAIIPANQQVCLGQRTMLLRTIPKLIDRQYLLIALLEPHFQKRMVESAIGATVKHLRVGDVENLVVPLPPLEEQKRIVTKVDELMRLCDQLEEHLITKEELGNRLAEAVVAAA